MKPAPLLFALLPLAVVLGGAWRWVGPPPPPAPAELRVAIGSYLLPLDFRVDAALSSVTWRLIDALWEPLLHADGEQSAARPGAAIRWEVREHGRRLVLQLDPDGRWSNGDPVVAADFVRSARWFVEAGLPHPLLAQLTGVAEYRAGKGGIDDLGIRALDERRLELEFTRPRIDPASTVADLPFMPLHASTPAALATVAANRSTPALVGNGRFKLEDYSSRGIVLRRNERHRHASTVALDRVRLIATDGPSVYRALFAAGRIDWVQSMSSQRLPAAGQLPPDVELVREDGAGISVLHFNQRRSPLSDVRVRRALSLALDRQELARRFHGSSTRAAFSLTPRIQEGEAEAVVYEHLPEARRLLAEAGYPEGRGFPVLRVPMVASGESNPLLYFCADQWRKKLGIRVYVVPLPAAEVYARVQAGEFDMIHYRWMLSPTMVSVVAGLATMPVPPGFTEGDMSAVNLLLGEAWQLEGRARRRKMAEAERVLLERMPLTPLTSYGLFHLKHARVRGWSRDVYGRHPFASLSVASAAGEGAP